MWWSLPSGLFRCDFYSPPNLPPHDYYNKSFDAVGIEKSLVACGIEESLVAAQPISVSVWALLLCAQSIRNPSNRSVGGLITRNSLPMAVLTPCVLPFHRAGAFGLHLHRKQPSAFLPQLLLLPRISFHLMTTTTSLPMQLVLKSPLFRPTIAVKSYRLTWLLLLPRDNFHFMTTTGIPMLLALKSPQALPRLPVLHTSAQVVIARVRVSTIVLDASVLSVSTITLPLTFPRNQ